MGYSVYPAAGGGVTPKVQTFTSTGTFTAPSNCQYVEVFLVGGGGGAGGNNSGLGRGGGGGGGGQVIQSRKLSVTPGTSYTVTIGAGGAGGTTAAGSVGGDSSFGSLLTAFGGGAGQGLDSGAIAIVGTARATQGGVTINGGTSGGGGGASQGFGYVPSPDTQPFSFSASNILPTFGGTLVGGLAFSNNFQIGGAGVDEYGGGGCGYNSSANYTWLTGVSVSGGGAGVSGAQANPTNGSNGVANKGGGGGTGKGVSYTSGNGGSGYAIVTYWS